MAIMGNVSFRKKYLFEKFTGKQVFPNQIDQDTYFNWHVKSLKVFKIPK